MLLFYRLMNVIRKINWRMRRPHIPFGQCTDDTFAEPDYSDMNTDYTETDQSFHS